MMIFLFLTTLIIAPQLWYEPLMGVRTDLIVYPLWLATAYFGTRHESYHFSIQDKFFVAMLFWILASTAVNGAGDRSMDILINYTKWFILYKLVSASIPTMDHLRRVSLMLIFFGMVMTIEGIQHFHSPGGLGWAGQPLGWVDPSAREAGVPGRTQWIGIFDGPGVFCVIYTVAMPFLMQYLNPPHGALKRLLAVVSLLLLGVAIFFNGARGGFLTALGIMGLFLALRYRISLIKIATIGGVVGILFMLAPAHLTSMSDESKSAQHRVDMWVEGVEMAQQNPVFGIGKGNFSAYTGKLIAHNSAIEIMGETGLVGLFFWIGLIYFSVKNLLLYLQQTEDPATRSLVSAVLLSIIGYLISAMFVTLEYETFYFLLGLSSAVGFHLKMPLQFTAHDFKVIAALTLGFFVLIKAFVMLYFA